MQGRIKRLVWTFSFILLVFFVVFLFYRLQFFMVVFVGVILSAIICKQVHSFVFVAFVYNFNIKRCKGKTPDSRFVSFSEK